MSFRPCCVIPSRNHHAVVGEVVRRLRDAGLQVFLVDDASDEPARSVLASLHAPENGISVTRLTAHSGKGGAVMKGFELAGAAGFSHVLQVDADGQHDLERLPELLARARERPEAVISGAATHDASVPRGRRYGRYITQVWVWIETLSFSIRDAMCGFRVYPLAPVMQLLAEERLGRFMDFDVEILVRLFWRGVPVLMVPVRVIYPPGNRSNFELLRDNWRISKMHARLFFTMLGRFPRILRARRRSGPRHWSVLNERGIAWGIKLLAVSYLWLGRSGWRIVSFPVVLYFYLTDAPRRRASREFLTRAFAASNRPERPGPVAVLRHFLDFAEKAVETLAGWVGRIPAERVRTEDGATLAVARASGKGALLIVSHLGNVDLSRAVLAPDRRARMTILVHTKEAERYNAILRQFQPDAAANMLQVTEIGPQTGLLLQEKVARGEWVAIAGDRTPVGRAGVGGAGRVARVPFLGAPAPFSAGPYILAHLLGCPVYLLHCLREGDFYRLYFDRFAERVELPRGPAREAAIADYAARYAARLAELVCQAPFQWYNFFDFWAQ